MGSSEAYDDSVAAMRAGLPETPEILDFIRYATLAASGHNTQPWRFRIGRDRIEILPDFSRRTPIVDPDDHHLFVSLGCATENLVLAAGAGGRQGGVRFEPSHGGSAVFEFESGPATRTPLCDAIPRRRSARTEYDGKALDSSDLRALAGSATVPGVDVVMLTERAQLERLRALVIAGNSVQLADRSFVKELEAWLRFTPRQALDTGDGLFSRASGSPVVPAWLGPTVFDCFFTADAENDKYTRQLRSSAGVAVFVGERDDREHWFRAGRACQRFALQATALGIQSAFINQPVEVADLRPDLAALVGIAGRRPDIVMRFGHGPALPYSARRPVAAVLA